MKRILATIFAFLIPAIVSAQIINLLPQLTATTSVYGTSLPVITQTVFGRPVLLTGLTHGATICTAANGLATTTGCAAGGLVDLTTGVTGVLPIANGGTGNDAFNTDGVVYYDGEALLNSTGLTFTPTTGLTLSSGPLTVTANATSSFSATTTFAQDIYTKGHPLPLENLLDQRISDLRRNNYMLSNNLGLTYRDENSTTTTLASGEQLVHGFIYARGYLWGTTLTAPAKLIRLNPNNKADKSVVTFANDGYHNSAYDVVYSAEKDRIYVLFGNPDRVMVSEVNPVSMAYTDVINDTSVQDPTVCAGLPCYIGPDGAGGVESFAELSSSLYVLTRANPSSVIKYSLSSYLKTGSTTLTKNDGHAIRTDGTDIYATGLSAPAWIARITANGLANFAQDLPGSVTATDDFALVGDNAWVCSEGSIGDIFKIKKTDLSSTRLFSGVNAPCYGAFMDGRYVWFVYNTNPGTLVRLDPQTSELRQLVLSTGNAPNEIVTDGQRYFVTSYLDLPAKIVQFTLPDFTFAPFMIASSSRRTTYALNNGNIGVGISDPAARLEVSDDSTLGTTELITNGSFTSNTSGWTAGNGATITSTTTGQSGNGLQIDNPATTRNGYASQAISTLAGARYQLSFYHKNYTSIGDVYIGSSAGTSTAQADIFTTGPISDTTWSQYSFNFRATTTTTYVTFANYTAGFSVGTLFDEISVKQIQGGNVIAHGLFTGGGASGLKILATGFVGIGTSTPYAALSVVGATGVVADHYLATSTTASSTFIGVDASRVCLTGTTTCLGTAGGGSGTVGTGLTGEIPWYASNGTTISASSSDSLTMGRFIATSTTGTSSIAGPLINLARIGVSTLSSFQHAFNIADSAGLTSGGTIATSAASVSVAAGTGLIKAADTDFSPLSFHDWVASSTLNVAATSTRFIGLDYNAGSPRVHSTTTENFDMDTMYETGIAVREWDKISAIQFANGSQDALSNIKERFQSICRVCIDTRLAGLVISNTGTRNLAITAGGLLSELDEYTFNAFNSSASQVFDYYYRNGSGGWIKTVNNSQWDNAKYDDGSGTLASVTALQYASAWIYAMTDGTVAILYGQTVNATPSIIFDEGSPATVPDRIKYMGILIGRFVFAGSGATPTRTISYTTALPASSNVQNHSELGGLAWATAGHTGTASTFAGFDGSGVATNYTELNYLLAAGTRALTGNWNVGNFDILGIDSASSTANSVLNALYVGRTGTTTILGDSATSTFSGGVSTTKIGTTATSSMAGLNLLTGGLTISTLVGCNGNFVLETDANGGVTCGADASGAPTGVANTIAAFDGSGNLISTSSNLTVGSLRATSTIATSSILSFFSVGSTTPYGNSMFSIGTTSQLFTVDKLTGFIGIATSTPGSRFSVGGGANISGVAQATSTFYGGINLLSSAGCFSVNGVCVGGGSGSGTVTSVATNNGLTGGTITTSGTLGLDITGIVSNVALSWNGSILVATGTNSFAADRFIATSTSGTSQLPLLNVTTTLTIPNSTSPSLSATGQIAQNTTIASSSLLVRNSDGTTTPIYTMKCKSYLIDIFAYGGAFNSAGGTSTARLDLMPFKARLDSITTAWVGAGAYYQLGTTSVTANFNNKNIIIANLTQYATTTYLATGNTGVQTVNDLYPNNVWQYNEPLTIAFNASSTAFVSGIITPCFTPI